METDGHQRKRQEDGKGGTLGRTGKEQGWRCLARQTYGQWGRREERNENAPRADHRHGKVNGTQRETDMDLSDEDICKERQETQEGVAMVRAVRQAAEARWGAKWTS